MVPVGTFTSFAPGSALLTGWTVTGPQGSAVSIVNGSFVQNGVSFAAQSGNQWLDLTGNGNNSTEGVSQSVATTVGNSYALTFYVGNTTGGSFFGQTSTVDLAVNGVQSFAALNANVNASGLTWQQYSFTFTATSASTLLAFSNGDPSNDNSNGLDSVSLVDNGPAETVGAVPEPSEWALMLAGLALVGEFGRRVRGRERARPRTPV